MIAHLFQRIAGKYSESIALDGPGGSITYAQLDRYSDVVAHQLVSHGVKPGSIVVTAFARSIDAVTAFIGILKAGAAYCPLDLADPPARHEWTLQDTKPTVILTSREIASELPRTDARILVVEDSPANPESVHPESFHREISIGPNDPACVMYTSGSTGRPKAALVPHRGIARLVFENDYVPFSPDLRVLLHSPMHFDAITFELWAPLLHGGACVLFGGGAVPSLHEFREHIRNYRVNTMFMGPAMFNLIVDQEPDLLEGIENMLVGGEALSPTHIRKAQAIYPTMRFVNGYGPTETTTFAVTHVVPRPVPLNAASIPIGKPLARTTCHLLDAQLNPVAEGEEGELFIGGDGVALGYLNRPELTHERFITDPFSNLPGARLYRTGDLCRLLPNGLLDYVGRADRQVKIRGRRIELGEIEFNVLQHPDVLQCTVTVQRAGDDKHIFCHYVSRSGTSCEPNVLREFLAARLPGYLVPRDLIGIAHLPRRPNGKSDTDALPLPMPRHTRVESVNPHAGMSSTESVLLKHWRDAAENDSIGPDDCFFHSGGTSLGAMRLCSLIERDTGSFIAVADLASHSTVRQMTAHLARAQFQPVSRSAPPVSPLNAHSAATNLFCVSGHIWNARSLCAATQSLEGLVNAYGLNYPGMDPNTQAIEQTEDLAAHFIEGVRAKQPHGPYHLLGYSYGGVVAFEIAQQLRRKGEDVSHLILLDAVLASAMRFRSPVGRAMVHARQLLNGGPKLLYRRICEHKRPKPPKPIPTDPAAIRVQTAHQTYVRGFKKYHACRYDGSALLIVATQRDDWMEFARDPHRGGWPAFIAGGLSIKHVQASHFSIVETPHAVEVAEHIRAYLTQAR